MCYSTLGTTRIQARERERESGQQTADTLQRRGHIVFLPKMEPPLELQSFDTIDWFCVTVDETGLDSPSARFKNCMYRTDD